MKSRFIDTCVNCGNKLPHPPRMFQGVLVCGDCYKIVSRCVERTQKELQMLFLVYTDMLRVALVKGELRPPPMPPAGKTMPPLELSRAFARMAENVGGSNDKAEEGPNGQGAMSALRSRSASRDGEVHTGGHHQALRGGRDVREVSEMPEGGASDRGSSSDEASQAQGLVQAPDGVTHEH